jgi:hypothetical protein
MKKKYKCVIANIKNITEESIVIIEANHAGDVLAINSEERPGTVVKLHYRVDDEGNQIAPDNGID